MPDWPKSGLGPVLLVSAGQVLKNKNTTNATNMQVQFTCVKLYRSAKVSPADQSLPTMNTTFDPATLAALNPRTRKAFAAITQARPSSPAIPVHDAERRAAVIAEGNAQIVRRFGSDVALKSFGVKSPPVTSAPPARSTAKTSTVKTFITRGVGEVQPTTRKRYFSKAFA